MIPYADVVKKLVSIQPAIIFLLVLLVIGLTSLCLVLNTKLVAAQSELIKDTKDRIEVIVDTSAIADAVAQTVNTKETVHEVRYEQVKGDVETIIKENTVFLNVCIPDAGVSKYNEYVSTPFTPKS